jgi:integrase
MPRTSRGPRYYATKNGWFANFDGERLRLTKGPKRETEAVANEKYEAERNARNVEVDGDRGTVWAVLNRYLMDCNNRLKANPPTLAPNTYERNKYFLTSFTDFVGSELTIRGLRRQHVTDWLAHMQQERYNSKLKRGTRWGPSTCKSGRAVLKTAFIWAAEEAGIISRNPLTGGNRDKKDKQRKRRPAESRVAITKHEYNLLLEQANRRSKKDFFFLLQFLYRTGARPAEMYLAKAEEWDETRQAIVIKAAPENQGRYKLAYLGEDRVIYIPDDMVPLLRQLMVAYPTGPIFRTESGEPWTNETICARFSSIRRAANRAAVARGVALVRKEVRAYSPRHAYVTSWVEAGKDLMGLAELLNTSPAMIQQCYCHLFKQHETLRDSVNAFDRSRDASSPQPSDGK